MAVAAFLYVAPAAWAVGDAQRRGQSGGVVFFLFYLFGPLSAVIWLAMRPQVKLVDRSPEEYADADDLLAAANRLDQLGEWDAAIRMYEAAGKRWPDQSAYVRACIAQIQHKQSLE
jgi:hypothetical protein